MAGTPRWRRAFCSEHCRSLTRRALTSRGLVLAAGGSWRLGQPKQLLPYRGATLLDGRAHRARVRASTSSSCARRRRGEVRASGRPRAAPRSSSTRPTARAARRRSPRRSARSTRAATCSCSCSATSRASAPATVRALLAGRGDAPLAVCRYEDGRGHPFAFSRARVRRPRPRCTATRACGSCSTARADEVVEVPVAGPGAARRRHVGGLRGGAGRASRDAPARGGAAVIADADDAGRRGSTRSTTSPTRAWRPRCSSRCACRSRCCSRARPAWARPRRRKALAAALGHAADAAAVLRGHRRRRGAVRVELSAPAAADPARRGRRRRRSARTTCSAATTSCAGRCCRRSSTRAAARPCCSSTSSTAPTTTSRRSCSSCSPRRR